MGVLTPAGETTIQSRAVNIDLDQISQITEASLGVRGGPSTGGPTQTLILNLFYDAVFTGVVEGVEQTSSGHALRGRLNGVPFSTFTLIVNGDIVMGTVRMPQAVYTIRTTGDGQYVVHQIDESKLLPLGEPPDRKGSLSVPQAPQSAPLAPTSVLDDTPMDDGAEIDVMVVYTPLAREKAGGRAAVEALIDLFVAETNQGYWNSRVTHRVRLVSRHEADYVEDGDSYIDLGRIKNADDGYMDEVHELREFYAADLVHFVVGNSVNVCGLAWLNRGGTEDQDQQRYGFGLTVYDCGGLVFAHELGHNMGLTHDRYEVGETSGHHYGYVNQRAFELESPHSARWRTIMAYNTQCYELLNEFWCTRILYLSNPAVTYLADPVGVPFDHPSTGADGPADAARTLNTRRAITGNYRRSTTYTPRPFLTMSPYWLAEEGGTATVRAALHRPLRTDTTVTVSTPTSNAISMDANRALTIPAGQTTSTNTVTITGLDNSERTGDVTLTISATARSGNWDLAQPEPVDLAIVDDETTPIATLILWEAEIVEGSERAHVSARLDHRSTAETTIVISALDPGLHEIRDSILVIPAGQTASLGRSITLEALDDDTLTGNRSVTISGVATNSEGVRGPENLSLTILDDEAPIFTEDRIEYLFTEGVPAIRFLPEAAHGNGPLSYSISPDPIDGIIFTSGPSARIGVSSEAPTGQSTLTLTATDVDGDTDTLTVDLVVSSPICPGSNAVFGASVGGMVSDCEILMSARDVLAGSAPLNWSPDVPMADWDSVVVSGSRVIEIRLQERKLDGELPSELGSLSHLRELSLWVNGLTGQIPPELGDLATLRGLSVGGNYLTGPIPPEFGNLSSLLYLYLWGNDLSGQIPEELGNLESLVGLHIGFNDLTGPLPPELGKLSNLEWLVSGHNSLSGQVPPELGNLSNIRELHLQQNELTGPIPAELGKLTKLQRMFLRGNEFTGCIPDALLNLSDDDPENDPDHDLDQLGLLFCSEHPCVEGGAVPNSDNTGLVSDCDALLASLDALTGRGDGVLNWVADTPMTEWKGVDIHGPPLHITSNRVTALRLGHLDLGGTIPPELGDLSHLHELYLEDNGLTGEIPPALSKLTNLWILSLSVNELSGEIPPEMGRMVNLRWLYLHTNQLTGAIPSELGSLWYLERLYLAGNKLTGCVPDALRDIPMNDLSELDLLFCSDHPCLAGGAVPDVESPGLLGDCEILLSARDVLAGSASLNWAADTSIYEWDGVGVEGAPDRVRGLYLDWRELTGRIPPQLGDLSSLETLALAVNGLSGPIPAELGKLSNLERLDLRWNHLRGQVPPELGRLSKLRVLLFTNNSLTGVLPQKLATLTTLTSLHFFNNPGLCAPANDAFRSWLEGVDDVLGGSCTADSPEDRAALIALYNATNGRNWGNSTNWLSSHPIRDWYGVAGDMDGKVVALYLYWGGLRGRLPIALTRLSNLRILYMPHNLLSGPIPPELGSLQNLRHVVLEANRLTGQIPPELGNLRDLERLNLADNQLTGEIPPELGGLDRLQSLHLAYNELTGCIPAGLQDIRSNDFDELNLSFCEVETEVVVNTCVDGGAVPDTSNIGLIYDCETLLESLDVLDSEGVLNWSAFTPITEWDGLSIGGTPRRVTGLVLRKSGLSGGLPSALGGLDQLVQLNLHTNELTGPVPPELNNLTNLQILTLHNNEFSGPIPDLSRLTRLRSLWLSGSEMSLTGGIPTWLSSTSRLEQLSLWGNDLGGPIPDLRGMTSLKVLKLNSTGLTGQIHAHLAELGSLNSIYLQNNRLTGSIPPDLGNLSNLQHLRLHNNRLTGSIPTELGGLDNLVELYLSNNRLNGSIPSELGDLADTLTHLYLDRNNFDADTCLHPSLATVQNNDLADLQVCASP